MGRTEERTGKGKTLESLIRDHRHSVPGSNPD